MSAGTHAVIAGGGVAGLATAAALARTGWRVTLFERHVGRIDALGPGGLAAFLDDPAALGAGIQMSPNACRCLSALGVLGAAEAVGFAPKAASLRDGRTGRIVYRAALGEAARARWGAPYLHLHRADLVAVLAAAAREAGARLVEGCRVAGWAETGVGPGARLDVAVADAEGAVEGMAADLLVIADGLGSRLAARAVGAAPARFTGQTAWRALVPTDALPQGTIAPEATVWAAPGRHAVTYYVSGGRLVNLVAVEERTAWEGEGWSEPGNHAVLAATFADFAEPVRRLIAAAGRPRLWGLFDRPAPPAWSAGRVVALGDAVHAMLPFMAQGAAMALEDAVVLARRLEGASVDAALRAWEAERRPRVARVAGVARANGAMFHRADGPRRLASHALVAAVSRLAPGLAAGRLDWLYGHDAVRSDARQAVG